MRRFLITMNLRRFSATPNSGTIDSTEINHFKVLANRWWDDLGPMKALHSMNTVRVPFIRDSLLSTGAITNESVEGATPLRGVSILEVGCGAGILSESLARLGGDVIGLDGSEAVIQEAKTHAQNDSFPNLHYSCESIENHVHGNSEKYDAVVLSEVIEHVTDKTEFLRACIGCLKPGGSVLVTTISKTWLASFLAIFVAEKVLKINPDGIHQYEKFVTPNNLRKLLEQENCKTLLVHGLFYLPITNKWSWIPDTSVLYALHAVKV